MFLTYSRIDNDVISVDLHDSDAKSKDSIFHIGTVCAACSGKIKAVQEV